MRVLSTSRPSSNSYSPTTASARWSLSAPPRIVRALQRQRALLAVLQPRAVLAMSHCAINVAWQHFQPRVGVDGGGVHTRSALTVAQRCGRTVCSQLPGRGERCSVATFDTGGIAHTGNALCEVQAHARRARHGRSAAWHRVRATVTVRQTPETARQRRDREAEVALDRCNQNRLP